MKQTFTLLVILILGFYAGAQEVTYFEDFDGFNSGDYIAQKSPDWTTWTNRPGTTEDGKVSDEQASSGSNSLKVQATASGGGPMDLLLPFKGVYNKGRFVQYMKLYIPAGKNAYFNYQATANAGTTWTLNGFFTADGVVNLTNSGNTSVFTTTYEPGTWFEFKIDANLDKNLWNVFIDGECRGSFTNGNTAVASLNLYGVNGNSLWYVDDVGFDYFKDSAPLVKDIGISNIRWFTGRLTGSESDVAFLASNPGSEPITGFTITATVNGTSTDYSYPTISIPAGGTREVLLPNKVTLVEGANDITIAMKNVNGAVTDDEICNNKTTLSLVAATPAPSKAVLMEEATGTWCPWCVRGTVFMDRLSNNYEGYFIPVAVHNNDPMEVAAYDGYITSVPGFSGFPGVIVNRIAVVDPSGMESPFIEDIVKPATLAVDAGTKWDPATRTLDISVYVDALENVTGDHQINVILTEDGVTGTTAGYNQANAYAGGGNGVMGGYEILPNPVPASQMVYDHVGRIILGLAFSEATTIKGDIDKGERRVLNLSTEIPAEYDVDNMYVIPVVLQNEQYINAKERTFDDALSLGVSGLFDQEPVIADVSLYPNPANNEAYFELNIEKASDVKIELMDYAGRVIASTVHPSVSGQVIIPVNIQSLPAGLYTAKLTTEQGIASKKLMVGGK